MMVERREACPVVDARIVNARDENPVWPRCRPGDRHRTGKRLQMAEGVIKKMQERGAAIVRPDEVQIVHTVKAILDLADALSG